MTDQQFRFPSASLPAVPSFAISCPPGWTAQDVPGVIAFMMEPLEAGAFRASVAISADRVPPPGDLPGAAERTLASARASFAELALVQEKVVTVDDRPAALRFVTFGVDGLEHRVLQLQVLFLVEGPHPHLFEVNATCLAAEAGRFALPFVRMVESMAIVADA